MSQQIPGNQDVAVGGNDSLSVGGDRSVRIGRSSTVAVVANQTVKVDKTLQVDAKDLVLRGLDSLTLVCGAASISLKKDGTVVIKGRDITIEGSGKLNAKASGDVVLKGSKILQN
ncbi:MAG: hypothetical protein RJA10_363 [Pseudomonadota bacterium]|jgi:type VI secretion system secreted protein VgrG